MERMEEMKRALKELKAARPNGQVRVGQYLKKIGRKYVYICDTWERTTIVKKTIEQAYNDYCA